VGGSTLGRGKRFFSFQNVKTVSGAHQASPLLIGSSLFGGYSGRSVKLTTAPPPHLVMNEWSHTSSPLVSLHGMHWDKFTFLFEYHVCLSVCLSIFDLKCLSDFYEIFKFSSKVVECAWIMWKSPQWPSHFTKAVTEFLVILSVFPSRFVLNSV